MEFEQAIDHADRQPDEDDHGYREQAEQDQTQGKAGFRHVPDSRVTLIQWHNCHGIQKVRQPCGGGEANDGCLGKLRGAAGGPYERHVFQ